MTEPTAEGHGDPRCARCSASLEIFWYFCPDCGIPQTWGDDGGVIGAKCDSCGWLISDTFSFCPWCRSDVGRGTPSAVPLKRPRGFDYDADCDYDCGGGVQYPMQYCPWCSRKQGWPYHEEFEGVCPHCRRGVDDAMDYCIWCGEDATGQNLIRPAIHSVQTLLRSVRVPEWDYRILVRPGISGVDPDYPKIVEIERQLVARPEQISWPALVGLIIHELGHSFLFHHERFARSPRFRRAFGDVTTPYHGVDESRVSFASRSLSRTPVNHVSAYASTHPLEDFAETFRFYVVRRGRLADLLREIDRTGKGKIVYEKFVALHTYLHRIRPIETERSEQYAIEWNDD